MSLERLSKIIEMLYEQLLIHIGANGEYAWKIIELSRATIIIGIVLIAIGITILINQRKIKKLLKNLEEREKE